MIARVVARAGTARAAEVGPGDDAAVLRTPDGRVVASTDVLVEGRHFRRDWSSAEDIGHKAAAANLADVAAMGGTATALLVGLACPPNTPTAWLEGVATGLAAECAPFGAAVVGGDLVAAAAGQRRRRPVGDRAGRPGRPGPGAALRRPPGRRRRRRRPAGVVGVRAGRAAPRVQQPARRRRRAPPSHPAVRGRPGRRRRRRDRDVRRQRRAARRRSGTWPPTAGWSSTWTGPRSCGRAWSRPARCSRWARRSGADPLAWVLTGGEDHALVATFPPRRRAAARGGRRSARCARAAKRPGVLVDGEPAADVVARGGSGGTGHVHFG